MKVTVYDEARECIGIAWHEDNHGYVMLPPATRECVAVYYSINDGPLMAISQPVRMPVDTELLLRSPPPRRFGVHSDVDQVDEMATDGSWWRRSINWLRGHWPW